MCYENHIRVVNLNSSSPCRVEPGEILFAVNRSGPLGNPHHMKDRSMAERLRVIALHKADLPGILAGSMAAQGMVDEIVMALRAGKKVALACHCAPLPCHGDNIREYVLQQLQSPSPSDSASQCPLIPVKRPGPRFHADGTLPQHPDTILVFGSNLRGRHGKGAALIAAQRFGAIEGVSTGLMGRSYGIPTKDERIQTRRLPEMVPAIVEFCAFVASNPGERFFVTRVGCGLAGLQDGVIATLFKNAFDAAGHVPANCSFAEAWRPWLEFEQQSK